MPHSPHGEDSQGLIHLLRRSFVAISAGFVGMILNFTYQLILSRQLSTSDFSEAAFALSIVSVLGLAAFPIRLDVLESILFADNQDLQRNRIPGLRRYLPSITKTTTLLCGFLVAMAPLLQVHIVTLVAVGLNTVPLMLVGYLAGVFLAKQRILGLMVIGVLLSSGKLLSGIIGVWFGAPVSVLLLLLALSSSIIVVSVYRSLGNEFAPKGRFKIRESANSLVGFLAVVALGQSDILALGFISNRQTAGEYATAAVLGKLTLLLAFAISDLSHESIVRTQTSVHAGTRVMDRGRVVIVVGGVLWILVMVAMGNRLTQIVIRSEFNTSPNVLGGIALVSLLQGLIIFSGYRHISASCRFWYLIPLSGCGLVVGVNTFFSSTSGSIICLTVAILVVVIFALEVVQISWD